MTSTVATEPTVRSPDPTPPKVTYEAGLAVVWLRGDQDAATAPALVELLEREVAAGTADLAVDLGGATFIDGATVAALVECRSALRGRGRRLTLRAPPRCVRRLFAICGVGGLLDDGPSDADGSAVPA